jgi:transposase
LVNEFRTSKLCNCCNEEIEKFLEKPSKKPKRKGKIDLCHGILRCQSVKHNCEIYHNRDKNAVQNMLKIVKSIFNTGKRPEVFCRSG